MKFAPEKYELIHFSTATRRFNMAATVRIQDVVKSPAEEVRVLGVWFDSKLKWTAHTKKIKEKMATQVGALARISTSTWGATLTRSRMVYSSVVRPAMTHGAAIWHTPSAKPKGVAEKLSKIQNKCLRIVTGAYKAVPTRDLETESFLPPFDLYLDGRAAAYSKRMRDSKVEQEIQDAYGWIQRRKRTNRRRRELELPPDRTSTQARWTDERDQDLGADLTGPQQVQEAWTRRWASGKAPARCWNVCTGYPTPEVLKLHNGLRKAESAVLIQIRTGRTRLAFFLYKVGVPEYISGQCLYGEGRETPRHVIIDCPLEDERRPYLYLLLDVRGRPYT
jgi:hypothetical protein